MSGRPCQPPLASTEHGIAAVNSAHFDSVAHKYDNSAASQALAMRTARALLKAYPFDEDTTRVMDFACGTGLISRQLAPYCKTLVGIDISPRMVERYNQAVDEQGIPSDEMYATCMALRAEEGALDGARFDVIVCGSSYHHFASIAEVTATLAYFLRPGGVLLVVDLLRTDDVSEQEPHTLFDHTDGSDTVVHKGGFTAKEIREVFEAAGLRGVSVEHSMSAKKRGRDVKLFIARGERGSATNVTMNDMSLTST